jgi:hypothetical protein
MMRTLRTDDQSKFIELNKRFMDEVEKGATWNELRWLIEEMKNLSKNFEHIEPAKVIAMDKRNSSSPTERDR